MIERSAALQGAANDAASPASASAGKTISSEPTGRGLSLAVSAADAPAAAGCSGGMTTTTSCTSCVAGAGAGGGGAATGADAGGAGAAASAGSDDAESPDEFAGVDVDAQLAAESPPAAVESVAVVASVPEVEPVDPLVGAAASGAAVLAAELGASGGIDAAVTDVAVASDATVSADGAAAHCG